MKELQVDLEMIGMAMEDVSRDLAEYYLDTENGQVIVLSEEASKYVRDDEYMNIRDLPDWQIDEIKVAENILNNQTGRYVNIPEKPTYESYELMVDFTDIVEDELLREKLNIALDGKGTFRRFKNVLKNYPDYEKKWFAFKATRVEEDVKNWLNTIGIKPL